MNPVSQIQVVAGLITLLLVGPAVARAELTRRELRNLVRGIERGTDDLKQTIEKKRGEAKGEERTLQEKLVGKVRELETATDRLRREVTEDGAGLVDALGLRLDVKRTVEAAATVDQVLHGGTWDSAIERDWAKLRTAVNVLAAKYDIDPIHAKD